MSEVSIRKFKEITESRRYCKCGHSILFQKQTKKVLCSHCGEFVFNTKKDEFEYRMKEAMIRNKKNEKSIQVLHLS